MLLNSAVHDFASWVGKFISGPIMPDGIILSFFWSTTKFQNSTSQCQNQAVYKVTVKTCICSIWVA